MKNVFRFLVLMLPASVMAVSLQISQFDDAPDPAIRGGEIVYTFSVENSLADTANNVVFELPLPATTTFSSVTGTGCSHNNGTPGIVTCNLGNLLGTQAVGGTAEEITVTLVTTSGTGSTINATATVSDGGDNTVSRAQGTTIDNGADLVLTQSVSPASVVAGGIATWTVGVENAGPDDATGLTITDTLPANMSYVSASGTGWSCGNSGQVVTCTRASLANGITAPNITILGKVTGAFTGTLTNVVTGTSAVADPNPNNTKTADVLVTTGADLAIGKSVSPSPALSAQAVTFTLTPRNLGPFSSLTVTVSDPLPADFVYVSSAGTGWICGHDGAATGGVVSCSRSSYAPGDSDSITIVATAPTVLALTATSNTATIGATATPDPDNGNNSGTVNFNIVPDGVDLSLTKTKTPNPVAQNQAMVSTLTVHNHGPQNAASGTISVTDTLDIAKETYTNPNFSGSNWTCTFASPVISCTYNAVLANGANASPLKITTTAVAVGAISNNAAVSYSGDPGDWNNTNNTASAGSTSTIAIGSADLSIVKSADAAGDSTLAVTESDIIYTLEVSNAGPGDADGIVISDSIQGYISGTGVTIGSISGGSATFSCTTGATVTCTQTAGLLKKDETVTIPITISRPILDGTLKNKATVNSTALGDPDRSNNTSDETTITVEPIADVEMQSKTVTPTTVKAGVNATYVLSFINNGPSSAQNVKVTDQLLSTVSNNETAGFTLISMTPSQGTCNGLTAENSYVSGDNPKVTCEIGILTSGQTETLTLVIRPNWQSGTAVRTFTNTASITTDTPESTTGVDNSNNSKQAVLTIDPAEIDMLVNMTDLAPAGPSTLGYTTATPVGNENHFSYKVSVTNRGPSYATGVAFVNTITPPAERRITFVRVADTPFGAASATTICSNPNTTSVAGTALATSCTITAGMNANSTFIPYLIYRVEDAPAPGGESYNNIVIVSANETDSIAPNDTNDESTVVRVKVDLSITKTPSLNPVQLRQPFDWTIVLTNDGPGVSELTSLTDTLPVGMEFFGASPTWANNNSTAGNGACTTAGRELSCSFGLLEINKTVTVTVPVRMTAYPAGGTTENCATATTSEVDTSTGNNTSVCNDPVLGVQRSSLAGVVYRDKNNNGTQSGADETGINTVNVRLTGTDAYDNNVDTQVSTNATGTYSFTNLSPAGLRGYTVTETQPATFLDGKETAGTAGGTASNNGSGNTAVSNKITAILLPGNTASTGYLFGELAETTLNSIAGIVYQDNNYNGIKGSGEAGISGVTVTLTGTSFGPDGVLGGGDDVAVASIATATNDAGEYGFTGLNTGNYTVTETHPTSYLDGKETAGTIGNVACGGCSIAVNDVISNIVISDFGVSVSNMLFGEIRKASISGFSYIDSNANATRDGGETIGLAGITVTLTGRNDFGGTVNRSTLTIADGSYRFTRLKPGRYSVTETPPTGLDNTGAQAGTPSNGSPSALGAVSEVVSNVVLAIGTDLINYNFGHEGTLLSGFVYVDSNGNGSKDANEIGIPSVEITLSGTASLGGSVCSYLTSGACVVTTDANGLFLFTQLPGSDSNGYTLTEQLQTSAPFVGYVDGQDTTGTVDAVDSGLATNDKISGIVINAGQVGTNYLFGEGGSSLSGTVYFDSDDNGNKSAGETGIDNVTITLSGTRASDGTDICTVISSCTAITDTAGYYDFQGLPEGTYTLTETHPGDWGDGKESTGTSGGLALNGGFGSDSLNNTISGISLVPGVNATDYLFGERSSGLSGRVCEDANDDGICQTDETGIAEVTMSLSGITTAGGTDVCTFIAPAACTVATATDGSYSFLDLPAGSYTLTETHPVVYLDGKEGVGSAGGSVDNTDFDNSVGRNSISAITLVGGSNGVNYDFGEQILTEATVAGHVWLDLNHDRVLDANETIFAGWTVALWREGSQIESVITDEAGFYSMNVPPNTGYELRFIHPNTDVLFGGAVPNEQGNPFSSNVTSTGNPAGGDNSTGSLKNLTIISGANIPEQSLPLDPAGVVYDSVTREPLADAVVSISGPGGFIPASHLLGGTANVNQTTGDDGFYQFLLLPGAPVGDYTLEITAYPTGYVPLPSALIPACNNTLSVGAVPGLALVHTSNEAPVTGSPIHDANACPASSAGLTATVASTQYYFVFNLDVDVSGDVVNNHIPVDRELVVGNVINVTKTTTKTDVIRGELVPYIITATNTESALLANIDLQDQVPAGFKYVDGSARMDGVSVNPTVEGRSLSWENLSFAGNSSKTIQLILIVGSGVSEGKYVNQAWAMNSLVDARVSNIGSATVNVVSDPLFDCSDLIGKVFDDKNINGYQDEGEPGLAGIRVVTVRGLLITTDDYGRFHLACADVPNELHGSNFIMKLDTRTLPSGYRVTTENPRVVRLTRGKLVKLNFGAALHRMLRIDIDQTAFNAKGDQLSLVANEQMTELVEMLKQQPSQMRLTYALQAGETESDANERMQLFADALTELWQQCDCDNYALTIEQEILAREKRMTTESATGRVK